MRDNLRPIPSLIADGGRVTGAVERGQQQARARGGIPDGNCDPWVHERPAGPLEGKLVMFVGLCLWRVVLGRRSTRASASLGGQRERFKTRFLLPL